MGLIDSLKHLFATPFDHAEAVALYRSIVEQSRLPVFYEDAGVADTPDGRFDMVALHAWLVMRRLRADGAASKELSQALFDLMFADMDQNMRELGVGDHGMPKRMNKLAESYYGRVAAYDEGLEAADDGALGDALRRNLFRKTTPSDTQVSRMAGYVRSQWAHVEAQPGESLLAGGVDFLAPSVTSRQEEAVNVSAH